MLTFCYMYLTRKTSGFIPLLLITTAIIDYYAIYKIAQVITQ